MPCHKFCESFLPPDKFLDLLHTSLVAFYAVLAYFATQQYVLCCLLETRITHTTHSSPFCLLSKVHVMYLYGYNVNFFSWKCYYYSLKTYMYSTALQWISNLTNYGPKSYPNKIPQFMQISQLFFLIFFFKFSTKYTVVYTMVLDHFTALQNKIQWNELSQFICILCISLVCGSMALILSTSRHGSKWSQKYAWWLSWNWRLSEDETHAFYSDDETAVLSSEADSNVTDQEEPHKTTTSIPLLSNVHSQKSQVQVYFEKESLTLF